MKGVFSRFVILSVLLLAPGQAGAQGSPAPGGGAPVPDQPARQTQQTNSAPPPGVNAAPARKTSKKLFKSSRDFSTDNLKRIDPAKKPVNKLGAVSIYNKLPITLDDAKIRLDELEIRLKTSRSGSLTGIKNEIFALSEWLQDVASAHWKMYKAFEKSAASKEQSKAERKIGLSFSHLKNKAKLLKADLYIKQNRYPEALQPLVEIVVAEPGSDVGQEAYKRLCDMGFSKSVASLEIANNEAKGEKK